MKVILGIDPGSLFTGFGAVKVDGSKIDLLACGVIAPPGKLLFNERIHILADEIDLLLQRVKPHVTVVEQVFLGKNVDSAFKLGHVRGIAIAHALRRESEVAEYAARAVKKGITGSGAATKEQVQLTLFAALKIKGQVKADASDALALAYYHAMRGEVTANIERSQVRKNQRESEL